MKTYTVAVVGALGAVGQEMLNTLSRRNFPVGSIRPLDVAANAGKRTLFNGAEAEVREARAGAFAGVDIALFSAGADASRALAPVAAAEGAIVIDNSTTWRMEEGVPLVIPEVNPEALRAHKGIIANPNCSTIQMLVALKPLHDLYRIQRVVVSTYQAVSGTGQRAIDELNEQAAQYAQGLPVTSEVYPCQILMNALPQIDAFLDTGYTKEEMKMVNETHKILDPSILVSPTAVRIPVVRGHSEAINIQTERPIDLAEALLALQKQPGITLMNDWQHGEFPTPLFAEGKGDVFVGRVRRDSTVENGLNLWVVADNLQKGAALNTVQIAEKMVEMQLV